ncbi:MAG: fused MFS/spermidine synthase [bacterium]
MAGYGDRGQGRSGLNAGVFGVVLILFFLSGISGLVYEVVWTRMLVSVFGATVFAVSTVLASFMAGLALGSYYFGRLIDRRRNPLRIYAYLEGGIGIYALLFPLLLSGLNNIYVAIYRQYHTAFYAFSLIRFALSFIVLLVPTTLMGATLPVISKFAIRRFSDLGWGVGWLYSVNTFGAALGALSAGFFLIGDLGIKESIYVASGMNLLVAAAALLMSKHPVASALKEEAKSDLELGSKRIEDIYPRRVVYIVFLSFALSGFAALAYEVLWTRALSIFSQRTVYSFSTLLTAFLVGIALGSFIFSRLIDRREKHLPALFGAMEVSIGILAISIVWVLGRIPQITERLSGVFLGFPGLGSIPHFVREFFISFLVMLLPTTLMGGTFPLVSRICTESLGRLGRRIGNVYSANTLGSIFGSLVAGFVLIPTLGIQRGVILIAFVNLVVGGAVLLANPSMKAIPKTLILSVSAIIAVTLSALTPPGVYLSRGWTPGMRLVYYKEGITGTVTVVDYPEGYRSLEIDGINVAGTQFVLRTTQKIQGHIPLLLHKNPKRVLTVGFGSGETARVIGLYDVEKIDAVEISPDVVEASGYFRDINQDVLKDPRLDVIIMDGKNYVLVADEKYDVIMNDSIHPGYSTNGNLYTKDYFELCKRRLRDGGVMSSWIPLFDISEGDFKMMLRTFQSVFPHTSLWYANNSLNKHALLVGTEEKLKIDFKMLKGKLWDEKIGRDLSDIHIDDIYALLDSFVMDEESVKLYVGPGALNTDDHPRLEFSIARSWLGLTELLQDKMRLENLMGISRLRGLPPLVNVGETQGEIAAVKERLWRYFSGTGHLIRGHLLEIRGMGKEAVDEYRMVLQINPEDKDARYLLDGLLDHEEKNLKEAIRSNPEDGEAHGRLGVLYQERGMLDEAISEYKKVIEVDSSLAPIAHGRLGDIYQEKGMLEEAISEYKEVIRADPGLAVMAHIRLGTIYQKKGMREEAIDEFKRALEIDPNNVEALNKLEATYQR